MSLRIGHGVDAHRLVAGRPLRLGGVEIPHGMGLEGHSDGDVAAHALAHAMLAAAGAGDLGSRFPATDPRWRGTDSLDFVREAARLAAERHLRVESAQVVVIAQAPRLAAHLAAMAEALGAAASAPPGILWVTVTSCDGLGFTGRGEGIAASAVVLLASVS
ncbi:MAG: 2-C-methyl-D-erythritol 2,4-cyclodiphosphate synthase [Candidatus Dormibacteria bacterium]